jgi:hypothetical protein
MLLLLMMLLMRFELRFCFVFRVANTLPHLFACDLIVQTGEGTPLVPSTLRAHMSTVKRTHTQEKNLPQGGGCFVWQLQLALFFLFLATNTQQLRRRRMIHYSQQHQQPTAAAFYYAFTQPLLYYQ